MMGDEMKRGEERRELGMERRREAELAQATGSARAKAEIEAAYTVAINHRRNVDDARIRVLEACRRTRFAQVARYAKPVGGGKKVYGPSIRFAEESAKIFGNIRTTMDTVYEDDDLRKVRLGATDLETNLTHEMEITIRKTVERRSVRDGAEILGERGTSQGNKVFIIRATEDDMHNKTQAQASKALRTILLRLIPQDIVEEAMDQIVATLQADVEKDPSKHRKAIADAFARVGVKPSHIEAYLGHPLESVSPAQIEDLRAIYNAIENGETSWAEVIAEGTEGGIEGATAGRTEALKARLARERAERATPDETPADGPEKPARAKPRKKNKKAGEKGAEGFEMTIRQLHEVEELAMNGGWDIDHFRRTVAEDLGAEIKSLPSQELYDKAVALAGSLGAVGADA